MKKDLLNKKEAKVGQIPNLVEFRNKIEEISKFEE